MRAGVMIDSGGIYIRGLVLRRGMVEVISALDLRLERGGVLVVQGANGSGKTTLLRGMVGLLPCDAGEVSMGGYSLAEDRLGLLGAVIYIGHLDGFSGHLSAFENLRHWILSKGGARGGARGGASGEAGSRTLGKAEMARVFEAFGMVQFSDTPLHLLSEGQRKKCSLMRLALSEILSDAGGRQNMFWILDEPLTSLDAEASQTVIKMIDEFTAKGGTVVLSSHQDIRLERSQQLNLGGAK